MTNKEDELTIELTNYCPHTCPYCSSNTTTNRMEADFIDFDFIVKNLQNRYFKRIILSGGEPLSHPKFYWILNLCKTRADDVIVYTNELTHIAYNVNIIPDIIVEANLTLRDNIKRLHVLKRIEQGREKTRPEVKFSRNWTEDCDCNKHVILPNGQTVKSPCKKEDIVIIDESPSLTGLGSVSTNRILSPKLIREYMEKKI